MKKKSFLQIIIFTTIILIILFLTVAAKKNIGRRSTIFYDKSKITKEYNLHYQVNVPNNFFVNFKDWEHFQVAEDVWKNNFSNIPTAGITTLVNYIPTDMSLQNWLNGIADLSPQTKGAPVQYCSQFINKLNSKYHINIEANNCLFYGVTNIKKANIGNYEGITFKSSNTSFSATHTLIKINKGSQALLFDIYHTTTGLSSEKDNTREAYETFLETIEFN